MILVLLDSLWKFVAIMFLKYLRYNSKAIYNQFYLVIWIAKIIELIQSFPNLETDFL